MEDALHVQEAVSLRPCLAGTIQIFVMVNTMRCLLIRPRSRSHGGWANIPARILNTGWPKKVFCSSERYCFSHVRCHNPGLPHIRTP